jgi:hypothetical protein
VDGVIRIMGGRLSLAVLLRRLAAQFAPDLSIVAHSPSRRSRDKLLMEHEPEGDLALAAERVGRHGLVVILLDSDDDCPSSPYGGQLSIADRDWAVLDLSVGWRDLWNGCFFDRPKSA